MPGFEITPRSPSFVAEVHGLDVGKPLSPETIAQLRAAWIHYKVLVLPSQDITDEQQVAFSRKLGPLEEFPFNAVRSNAQREIFRVANVDEQGNHLPNDDDGVHYLRVTQLWHVDSSYRAVPSTASILRGIQVTREGGETWFADLVQVYAELPPHLKARAHELRAIHDFHTSRRTVGHKRELSSEERARTPAVEHPFVRVHPETGVTSLFLSPCHTERFVGMTREQSVEILEEYTRFATQERFVYRHRWWPRDIVMWDNWSVMHHGQTFDATRLRRVMHRTTIAGERAP